MSGLEVSVACGNCGGNLLMATCDHFRGTGHEWVLVTICMVCRTVHWTQEGCRDCRSVESRIGRIAPLFDGDLNPIRDDEDAGPKEDGGG